ncbi:MAG: PAS domain S-box protein, partial [bacterium]
NAFDETDVAAVETLSTQLATAIENARLYEQAQKEIAQRKKSQKAMKASEEKYRDLVERLNDVIYTVDENGMITYISPAVESLFGYTPSEVLGQSFGRFIHPENGQRIQDRFEKVLSGKSTRGDYRIMSKTNDVVWVHSSNQPVFEGNRVVGAHGLLTDITERKYAEEALRTSEEKHRTLFEEARDGIVIADAETGVIIDCNPAAARLVGRNKSELTGKHQSILHPPEEIEGEFSRTFKQHLKEKEGQVLEAKVITKKRKIIDVDVKANIFELEGKRIIQGIFRDITERKRAEEMLQFTQISVDRAADAVFWMGPDAKFVYVNDAACRVLEYSREELLSMTVHDIDPDFPEEVWADHWADIQKRQSFIIESRHRTKSGKIFPVEISVNYMKFGGREYNIAIARNVTERKRAEEEIEKRQKYLESVLQDAPDAIVTIDASNRLTEWNQGAEQIFGYERKEVIGKNIDDLITQPDVVDVARALTHQTQSGEAMLPLETVRYRKDGTPVNVIVAGSPIKMGEELHGIVVVYTDITERKKNEERIKASLAEKEILLKEIHHRVKNNLQVISSLLSLQSRHVKDEQALAMFRESQDRVKSMALIHEKLYQSEDLAHIDFSGYIQSLANDLFRAYRCDPGRISMDIKVENVSLTIDAAIPCGLIINELVSNALKYAFPPSLKRRGKVSILLHPTDDGGVELIVKDNGVGMSEDLDIRKLDSLGMKLITVLAEDQLGGKVKVEKKRGMTFRIRFKR